MAVAFTSLLTGDSQEPCQRITTTNTYASCALRSAPVLSHLESLSPRPPSVVCRNNRSVIFGLELTRSSFLWGTPHNALDASMLFNRSANPYVIICSSPLPHRFGSVPFRTDLSPPHRYLLSPVQRHVFSSSNSTLGHRSSITAGPSVCSRLFSTTIIMYRRSQAIEFLGFGHRTLFVDMISLVVFAYQLPNPLASQLTFLWGKLVFLTNFLKVTDRFIGIFTEVDLHTMFYSSCAKSLLFLHLPVDSSGSSSSSLVSFSLEKRTVLSFASFVRSVSLPNIKWKCLSISITVLLSCVAVRLGPEDATDFVLTILRGADLVSTSQFKVTNSQGSGSAVNLASTHSSFTLNLLSFYLMDLAISYVVMFYVCGVLYDSLSCCTPNA